MSATHADTPLAVPAGPLPAGVEIHPPRQIDRRAWRMLLPEAASSPEPCRVLVATMPLGAAAPGGPHRRVIGAIAATVHYVLVPQAGPKVLPHVIPPMQRQGIGRALMQAMESLVLAWAGREGRDPQVLHNWSLLHPDSPQIAIWRSLGFTGESEAWIHEVDLRATEAWLGPALARIAHTIPADARIIRLEETTPEQKDQMAALHVEHLGGRPHEMRELIGGQHFRPTSAVLVRGDRVVGFSLSRTLPEPGVVLIDANVLEPQHRMGWANILLKCDGARRLIAQGIERARFQTFAQHTDTRGFARRTGDTVAQKLLSLHRPLQVQRPAKPADL